MTRSTILTAMLASAVAIAMTLAMLSGLAPSVLGAPAGASGACASGPDGPLRAEHGSPACMPSVVHAESAMLATAGSVEPAARPTGSAPVTSIEVATATSEPNATPPYAFVAQAVECPAGMLALGGGFTVLDAEGAPIARPIAASEPEGEPATAWSVTASLDVGMAVRVYAMCATAAP